MNRPNANTKSNKNLIYSLKFCTFEKMTTKKSILHWAEDDRPREKLLKHGKQTLSNAELLAILLGSGSRDYSAVDLAKQILAHYDNNLSLLARASAQELCKNFKGIGTAKAVSILAAMEIATRKSANADTPPPQITDSETAYQIFISHLKDLSHEEFWVTLLTNSNRVITTKRLSIGGTNGTVVDKKILLKLAVEHLATSIIIAHNHPSENTKPSKADIAITESIKEVCQLLDIKLLDHIIICGNTYVSLADEGLL